MAEKLYTSIHSIISDYGNYIDTMCSEENNPHEKSDEARSEKTLSEQFFINLHSFRIKDVSDLSIDLKLQEKLIFILESGVLKALENKTLHTYFRKYIFEESILLLSEQLFWIALLIKYQFVIELEEDYIFLVQDLRKQIGLNYICLLAALPTTLKEELINLIIFIIGYLILSTLYALLKYERINFSNRYIFDCFHIVLFELNGIYISDFYIKSMVEKIFTNKFLVTFKGKEKGDNLKLKSQERKNKDFLEKRLILPSINIDKREYTDFAHDLSQKLYKNKPLNIRKNKSGQKVVADSQKSLKTIGDVSTSLDKNSRFLTEASLHSNKPLVDESFSNRSKFNCCQISPTISNILDNQNMTLQFSKKKLINHFSENSLILNENSNILSKIVGDIKKNESKVEPPQPSLKKNPSILDRYNYSLNNLNEDYRSKNKFLQEMYELKFILDKNHQKTNQYQSSLKIKENQLNERNKIPQDFLLDDGYSPYYVNMRNSLITEEERINKEIQRVEEDVDQFNFDFDVEKKENNLKALLKRGNTLAQRNSIKNNHAILKIKEKPEYADLKVIIEEHPNPKELLKVNLKLEEEEDENNSKLKNYELPDFNKNIEKYKKEHTHLIGRNVDSNIESIISKIVKTKDNFHEMERKMKVKAKAKLSKLSKLIK